MSRDNQKNSSVEIQNNIVLVGENVTVLVFILMTTYLWEDYVFIFIFYFLLSEFTVEP